jgi:hypothetical protein
MTGEAQRRAVELAQFYFRRMAQEAGAAWDGDNDAEVDLMVGCIIDAAALGLRSQLDGALERIRSLEQQTPQARQVQLEADLAAADLAESGYDRHGGDCQCSYCATDEPEPDEYDPGPEVDDEGGMSEYRYTLPEDYQRGQS